jgi:putative PIN family toxin of toxin-antitoxin system
MRVVIDTNVLISALVDADSLPAYLVGLWREGKFQLVTSPEQVTELMRVTRYAKIRKRLVPALAGRLINGLRDVAIQVAAHPDLTASADPDDNYLLATAVAGSADYLVTGDKRHLLNLIAFQGTKIVTTRVFLALQKRFP